MGSSERPPFVKEQAARKKADDLTPEQRLQAIVLIDDNTVRRVE